MCVQTLAATTGWVVVLSVYFLQFFQDKDETNGVRGKKKWNERAKRCSERAKLLFFDSCGVKPDFESCDGALARLKKKLIRILLMI